MVQTWTGPALESAYAFGPYTVGMFAFGPVILSGGSAFPDEIFLGVDYIFDTGGGVLRRRFRLLRLKCFANPYATDTLISINTATASPVDQYWGMSFTASRMKSAAPFTDPGIPVVVTEWSEPGPGTERHVWVFPDPATPTGGAVSLATRAGQIIGHQGRIVFLENASYSHGSSGGLPTNEQINFTEPPNSMTLGTQQEVFMQEFPNGFGTWGSISAGELFLVKNVGGGVLIQGDVASPDNVVRLPGVTPTGLLMSKAASTPKGLFYLVNEGGVHGWRGSDTSESVSPQLDESAFPSSSAPSAPILNVQAHLEAWHDWVLVSNNWLLDTTKGGWWRLEDPAVANMRWFSRSAHGNRMFGAPVNYLASAAAYMWDKTVPVASWSWQSHPLPASRDRIIEIREIVLLAQGSGTVVITNTALDGSSKSETFTLTNSSQPQRLKLPTSCQGYNIVTRIQSDSGSTTPAPVVYSVALNTRERQRAVTT